MELDRKNEFIHDLKIDTLSIEEVISKYYIDTPSYFFFLILPMGFV